MEKQSSFTLMRPFIGTAHGKDQFVCSLSFKKIVSFLIKKRIKSIQSLWLLRLIVFSSFLPWACTIKLFTAAINQARLFLTISHFHPSLIFADKARNLDLTWKGSTQVPE
jgi:hypothetical protein